MLLRATAHARRPTNAVQFVLIRGSKRSTSTTTTSTTSTSTTRNSPMVINGNVLPRTDLFAQPTVRELLARQARDASDERVTIRGWIRTQRKSKTVHFLEVSDGSTNKGLQCVVDVGAGGESGSVTVPVDLLHRATAGASVCVDGVMTQSTGHEQAWELHVDKLVIIGDCDPVTYPLQKKRHTLEFMRDGTVAHLRHRSRLFTAITSVRHECARATHEFFEQHHFKHLHTPLVTSLDCEGGGEVFRVEGDVAPPVAADSISSPSFFGKPAYLTVSSQLHLEMAVHGLSRVYTLAPCFRADPGSEQSVRHLAEFWMTEAEWAWPRGVGELTAVTEALVKHVAKRVREQCSEELDYLERETVHYTKSSKSSKSQTVVDPSFAPLPLRDRINALIEDPFHRLTYDEAFKLLRTSGHKFKHALRTWGQPLQTEHERWLCATVGEGKRAVFVTDYPEQCKAFYMRRNDGVDGESDEDNVDETRRNTVACFDLLIPRVGELAGGSMREDRLAILDKKMTAHGLDIGDDTDAYGWYRDLRRYGTCQHGGFGVGFDRLVMYLTGMENIRDVVPCPRSKSSCKY